MQDLGGYEQADLDALWDALGSDDPPAGAMRIADEEGQQVMSILADEGQVVVTRAGPGETWERVV